MFTAPGILRALRPSSSLGAPSPAALVHTMAHSARSIVSLVLGILLLVGGLAIWARLFVLRQPPATGSMLTDLAFSLFFVVRGAMNLRSASRRPRQGVGQPPGDAG